MKRARILMILSICLLIVSCINGQSYRTVRGDGNVVKRDRSVSYFDGVRVSTGIDVYLTQGEKESITVEADENLQEYILTEVRDNVLVIRFDNVNVREAETKRVHVTIKDVKSLKTTSAGDIICKTPIKADDLELDASSAGDISMELYAKNVVVDISSSGNIKLWGEADNLDASLSSAGDLEAYDFKVKEAKVGVSSAGDARINVTEKLVARASSAGDVTYRGNPKSIDAHSSSAGGIHSR